MILCKYTMSIYYVNIQFNPSFSANTCNKDYVLQSGVDRAILLYAEEKHDCWNMY